MSRKHDWKPDGRDNLKAGEWSLCSGCSKRIFFPDGWTDFQKTLTVAMAWMEDVDVLSTEELARRTIPDSGGHGMDKGYHGVLSEDCDEARRFVAESVMMS